MIEHSKVIFKEEITNNSKSTFRKPGNINKAYSDNKSNCSNCGGEPHGNESSPSTIKKRNSCGKIGHFAVKYRSISSNNNTGYSRFNERVNHQADGVQFSKG